MTQVLLTHQQTTAEKTIAVPAGLDFPAFLVAVRHHEPDRAWDISEVWDIAA